MFFEIFCIFSFFLMGGWIYLTIWEDRMFNSFLSIGTMAVRMAMLRLNKDNSSAKIESFKNYRVIHFSKKEGLESKIYLPYNRKIARKTILYDCYLVQGENWTLLEHSLEYPLFVSAADFGAHKIVFTRKGTKKIVHQFSDQAIPWLGLA